MNTVFPRLSAHALISALPRISAYSLIIMSKKRPPPPNPHPLNKRPPLPSLSEVVGIQGKIVSIDKFE